MIDVLLAASDPTTQPWITTVGPNNAVQLFGVKLVGINADNGLKLLFTIILLALGIGLARFAQRFIRRSITADYNRAGFWARQGVSLAAAVIILIGLVSIWFDDPTRLTTGVGLISAGLAFALQRVVTALAGYLLILRGSTFNVGDRIVMGGVRGDVIALGFLQTTIMEMGQPPPVQNATPAMWVRSRQFTGRIVTVSNAQVFDEPVFNYSREFSYIWEELALAIAYRDDHAAVERMLLDAAHRHAADVSKMAATEMAQLERLYNMPHASMEPKVFWRMTDNWLELSVRFLVPDHGARDVKDLMARDLVPALHEAGIEIASSTIEITGFPPMKVMKESKPSDYAK